MFGQPNKCSSRPQKTNKGKSSTLSKSPPTKQEPIKICVVSFLDSSLVGLYLTRLDRVEPTLGSNLGWMRTTHKRIALDRSGKGGTTLRDWVQHCCIGHVEMSVQ